MSRPINSIFPGPRAAVCVTITEELSEQLKLLSKWTNISQGEILERAFRSLSDNWKPVIRQLQELEIDTIKAKMNNQPPPVMPEDIALTFTQLPLPLFTLEDLTKKAVIAAADTAKKAKKAARGNNGYDYSHSQMPNSYGTSPHASNDPTSLPDWAKPLIPDTIQQGNNGTAFAFQLACKSAWKLPPPGPNERYEWCGISEPDSWICHEVTPDEAATATASSPAASTSSPSDLFNSLPSNLQDIILANSQSQIQ